MIRITRRIFIHTIYITIDVFFIMASMYCAALIRHRTLPFDVSIETLFFDSVNPFRYMFYFWVLVLVILNKSYGLYETKRELFEPVEVWRVVKSVFLSALMVITFIFERIQHDG